MNQTPSDWAKEILEKPYAILDTETTGLGEYDQIVQIGALLDTGESFQTYVKSTISICSDAQRIHGISDKDLEDAPYFDEVFINLWRFVGRRDILIYYQEFDLRLIRQSLKARQINIAFPTSDRRGCKLFPNGGAILDAMQPYSEYIGEWNDYHGNYKWQKLPGGDHSALGDCKAVLAVLEEMANG